MRPGIWDKQYHPSQARAGIYDFQYFEEITDLGRPPARRRKRYVEIDGELFEATSDEEYQKLLATARELAQQTAEEAASKAVAKALKAKTPAAAARALAVPLPTLSGKDLTEEEQAQLDAAKADIAKTYAAAVKAQQIADDEEVSVLMLADKEERDVAKVVIDALNKLVGKPK